MMIRKENEPKTRKQKLAEPILNPKQVLVFCIVVIYEVISNLVPLAFGVHINWVYVLINIGAGILAFAITMMLRATQSIEVPDTSIIGIFKIFFKQIVDALFENKEETSDLKTLLERMIVWSVREWDVIYQKELKDATDYYRKKYGKDAYDELIEVVEEILEELSPEEEAKELIDKLKLTLEKIDPEMKAETVKIIIQKEDTSVPEKAEKVSK